MAAGPIAVVGAGAWGTALANAAALAGNAVTLWSRDAGAAARMQASRHNAESLPDVALHVAVSVTAKAEDLAGAGAVLLVVPAQAIRAATAALPPLASGVPLVICAKGIERGSGSFLSDVVAETRPGAAVAVLSGPSFAADVARGLPTAVALSARDGAVAERLAAAFTGPTFRVYHGTDVRGVEIGGAAKNVLAIACGAVVGRGRGESAKAALMARGFAELLRFAEGFGAARETLMGLSGLGDLVLTPSSAQSRNFAFGERLGRGIPLGEAGGGKLAEGALTAPVLVAMAAARGIDMPIASAVAAVIAGELTLPQAIDALMQRPLKREH